MVWRWWQQTRIEYCEETEQIRRLRGSKNFISEKEKLVLNTFLDFQPVQRLHNRSDVLEPGRFDNSASKRALDLLKSIYLIIW